MAISTVTYALSKKYTDDKVIKVSEDVIEEAVSQAKQYTDEVATSIEWKTVIVDTLPSTDIDLHTIYFIPASDNPDRYDGYFEYLYINGKWEIIGRTTVDLSNYYTKAEVEQYVEDHQYILIPASENVLGGVKVGDGSIGIDNEGNIYVHRITEQQIDELF